MAVDIVAQQYIALKNPVRLGTELNSFNHFGVVCKISETQEAYISVHLTVDCDPETLEYFKGPRWHVSLAFHPDNETKAPFSTVFWRSAHHRLAREVMQRIVLANVGLAGDDTIEIGIKAIHLRRELTHEELEKVGALGR